MLVPPLSYTIVSLLTKAVASIVLCIVEANVLVLVIVVHGQVSMDFKTSWARTSVVSDMPVTASSRRGVEAALMVAYAVP